MPLFSIYRIDSPQDEPQLISHLSYEIGDSLQEIRKRIDYFETFEFPYDFWDVNHRVCQKKTFERGIKIIDIGSQVTIIPAIGHVRKELESYHVSNEESSYQERSCKVGGSSHNSNEANKTIQEEISNSPVDAISPCIPPNPVSSVPSVCEISSHQQPALDGGRKNFHSKLIKQELKECLEHAILKLEEFMADRKMLDHKWDVRTWDEDGVAMARLWCNECGQPMALATLDKSSITNCFSNFKQHHVETRKHYQAYCRKRKLPINSEELNARRQKRNVLNDEAELELGVRIVERVNEEMAIDVPKGMKTFYVVGDLKRRPVNLYYYRVGCFFCETDFASFVPPHRNLEFNLKEHVACAKHKNNVSNHGKKADSTAILSGRPGRPTKVDGRDVRQKTIHTFFGSDQGPPVSTSGSSSCTDKGKSICTDGERLSLLCWGLWQDFVKWRGSERSIKSILADQMRGQNWYAEPYVSVDVYCMTSACEHSIRGLFRHVECSRISILRGGFQDLTCSKCWDIKLQTDFRLRVYREERVAIPRGIRDTGSGRRLDYLTIDELRIQSRVYNRGLVAEKLRSKRLMARLCMLQTKIPSLREVLGEAADRKDIKGFCSSIVLAHKRGAFGGKEALWDMLRDIVLNLNRKSSGKRYSKGTKAIMQALLQHGGRRVIDCLATNMLGPSLNTLQRDRRGMSYFRPGLHEEQFQLVAFVYRKIKDQLGINGDMPCFLAEDETAIKKSVRWISRTDSLVGFCGSKDNHTCISGLELVVGSGEDGFQNIVGGFEHNRMGVQARCIIVNPMHESFPRLCLFATSTCNGFNAEWVRDQWDSLMLYWAQFCRTKVGPILGHASDGDPRRRKLMLEDYTSKGVHGVRVNLSWEGWPLSHTQIGNDQDPYGLHDQDHIHNGKKLINPLDSPVKVLKLGACVASITHVSLIFNLYHPEEHALNREDIRRNDRQNWASAQRLMSRKVQRCLQLVMERGDARIEMVLGTKLYLEVCSNYVDIFLDVRLTLREKVVLCGKVGFFFRLWRLWLLFGNHSVGSNTQPLSLKNMVSSQTFLDIQMSVHFVVLMIVLFRDKYPQLPIPFHLCGSDACEQFFSKVGGMKGHERSYDFAELMDSATGINRLAELELCEGVAGVGRTHKKHKNIWMKLHPLEKDEVRADLLNYSGLSTNEQVVDALKEGLMLAQNVCTSLQMCPSTSAKDNTWFKCPWQVENNPKKNAAWCSIEVLDSQADDDDFADGVSLALQPLEEQVDSVMDGAGIFAEVLRDDGVPARTSAEVLGGDSVPTGTSAEVLEDDGVLARTSAKILEDDGVLDASFAHEELQHTLSDLVGDMCVQDDTITKEKAIVDPTVSYEGKRVYKSTLVSQLVGNPMLSKDRLTRVKQSVYFNNLVDKPRDRGGARTMFMQGGTDIGVYFVQAEHVRTTRETLQKQKGKGKAFKSGPSGSVAKVGSIIPRDKAMWYLGRVQFIRKKYNGKWGRCREPIDLLNRPSGSAEGSICEVQCNWFTALSRNKYKYNIVDHQWISIESIISVVSLTCIPNQKDTFCLDDQDAQALDDFVKAKTPS